MWEYSDSCIICPYLSSYDTCFEVSRALVNSRYIFTVVKVKRVEILGFARNLGVLGKFVKIVLLCVFVRHNGEEANSVTTQFV